MTSRGTVPFRRFQRLFTTFTRGMVDISVQVFAISKTSLSNPMNHTAICPTHLISDLPDTVDHFGSHQRIANAIATIVLNEPGGRFIALEGQWGSGKTTVVNILMRMLSHQKNLTLVPFDAWSHENDPLRRVFIETLVEHFGELKWIDRNKWDRRVGELGGQRETKTSTSTPQFTALGKLTALSVFLVPFGVVLINSALREQIVLDSALPIAWKFVVQMTLGLLFGSAPALVFATHALIKRKSDVQESARSWALLFNREITEQRTDTIKTPDPTSIEFEKTFNELMSDALVQSERRVILVIDNLDRVDAEQALAIWSNLQTFLRHAHYKTPTWFDRFWLLILYDPSGLTHLWHGRTPNQNIGSSFLNKSFQIRFSVPHPVLSQWRQYLLTQLSAALPAHSSAEFHEVYQVLALSSFTQPERKTVRGLKLFANQIGSIHRQWQDEFPLSHMAYFVILSDSGTMSTEWLLKDDSVESNLKGTLRADNPSGLRQLKDSLAALFFNVETALARELLLREPIFDALTAAKGAADKLRDISSGHEGFWEVVERVFTDDPFRGRGELIAHAAHSLERSNLLQSLPDGRSENIKRELSKAALRPGMDWSNLSTDTSLEGICLLLKWSDDREFTVTILGSILSTISKTSEDNIPAIDWVKNVQRLSHQLALIGHNYCYNQALIEPLVHLAIKTDNTHQCGYVVKLLLELSLSDTAAQKAVKDLVETRRLIRAIDEFDRELVAKAFLDFKNNPTQGEIPFIITTVATLVFIFVKVAPSLYDESEIQKILDRDESEVLVEVLRDGKNFYGCQTPFVGLTTSHKRLPSLIQFMRLTALAEPFMMGCLAKVSPNDYSQFDLEPNSFLRDWRIYARAFHESRFYHIVDLAVRNGLVPNLCHTLFNTFDPRDVALYSALLYARTDLDIFTAWLREGLQSYSVEGWIGFFQSFAIDQKKKNKTLLDLVSHLRLKLGINYRDAVIEYARRIALGLSLPIIPLVELLAPLTESVRHEVSEALYEIASTYSSELHDQFVELFGSELLPARLVSKKQRFLRQLVTPLLNNVSNIKWTWIVTFVTLHAELLQHYPITDVEDLRETMIRTINEHYEKVEIDDVEAIAMHLKLDRNELRPLFYRTVLLLRGSDESAVRFLVPPELSEEQENEGMLNVLISLSTDHSVGLVDRSGELKLLYSDGTTTHYTSPRIIELLRLRGMATIAKACHDPFIEIYECTEEGRRVHKEFADTGENVLAKLRLHPEIDPILVAEN